MPADNVRRAHYDDIEFDDQLALLDNTPFTGVIYENYPDGRPQGQYLYTDGLPSGIQRLWYPDGQLKEEWDAIRGRGSTWSREWYPNGIMKFERIDENQLPVSIREWSEDGQLLKETIKGWAEDCRLLNETVREWSEDGQLLGETFRFRDSQPPLKGR